MAKNIIKSHRENGFTLVELIVALALGVIISGAAFQLFTGGIVSARMQQASADLQDSGLFGLEYIAKDIRQANYGNIANIELNDATPSGGIVLTQGKAGAVNLISDLGSNETTKTANLTNVNVNSDQLTIQFIAPNQMANCEGVMVEKGDYIIQRYFLRKDDNGLQNDLALACDANAAGARSAADIKSFGGNNNLGEIIMPRVDYLKFYLGARSNKDKTLSYYTIDKYKSLSQELRSSGGTPPNIVSVKIEVIVRSRDSTASKMIDPLKGEKSLDDKTITPLDDETPYLRRQYVTTVALRNALGENL